MGAVLAVCSLHFGMPTLIEDNRQLESRMREIRLSGSEGGVGRKPYPYPYFPVPLGRENRNR